MSTDYKLQSRSYLGKHNLENSKVGQVSSAESNEAVIVAKKEDPIALC